jgi:GT2 family glycosyltransferase
VSGISVIICCYNSAPRLPETLKHLNRQVVPPAIPWEVIIVNNASEDDTSEVAVRLWAEFGKPTGLRVMEEPKPGLSHARQCGASAAQYDTLVFVDDDNWLHEDYLRVAYQIMSEHGQIGILGGKIVPALEAEPPKWFAQMQSWYAVGPQGRGSGDITDYKCHVAGAGMVLRKAAYNELKCRNFQFLLADRKGSHSSTGGDMELCFALALLGYRIWYDERLHLVHFIPKQRLTRAHLLRLAHGNRIAKPVLACYEAALSSSCVSGLRLYLRSVIAHSEWALKSAAKFILGQHTFTTFQVEFLDWWHCLLSLPGLRRAFRLYYPQIIGLKQGAT